MGAEIRPNSLQAWILAARPKTLAAAITPVAVGCALAYYLGAFQLIPALCCLLFAISMQTAANLINDLYDFLKGSDGEDRLGPLRATAQGWITQDKMKIGIATVVIFGCLCGSILLFYAGWKIIFVGLFCVIFAYLYTAGPFPLAYNGLGDVAVILFFGLIAVGFTAYVQVLHWDESFTYCGLATGFAINALLVLNNYRDRETDALSGKHTSIVKHGEKFGRYLYLFMGILAIVFSIKHLWIGAAALTLKIAPNASLQWIAILIFPCLVCAYLIPHWLTWLRICEIRAGKELNQMIGKTSRNMLIFAVILSLSLVVAVH